VGRGLGVWLVGGDQQVDSRSTLTSWTAYACCPNVALYRWGLGVWLADGNQQADRRSTLTSCMASIAPAAYVWRYMVVPFGTALDLRLQPLRGGGNHRQGEDEDEGKGR